MLERSIYNFEFERWRIIIIIIGGINLKIIFKVEDFLKIEKAEIDITNFCVFIGNNNSGKTKLMELIYGVLNYLPRKGSLVDYRFRNGRIVLKEEKLKKMIDCINEVLKNEKEQILQSIFNKDLTIGSMKLEVTSIDKWYEVINVTRENMGILYDEEIALNKVFNEVEKIVDEMNVVVVKVYESKDESIGRRLSVAGFANKKDRRFMKNHIGEIIIGDLLGINGDSHLFFPASRMGLMMLYKEYFNNVGTEGKVWFNGEETLEADTYQQSDHVTKPVLDFLRFLQGYSFNISNANRNADLIDFINEHLLEGALNEKGDMALYTPKNSEIRVPLYLASSMINEIDPLMKMLTGRKRTRMLFYDEIETSMHPLKQLEMVKLLNRLNNKGIRIILTTHSDTFVTKMNNLLLLSRTGKIDERQVSIRNGKVKISNDDLLKTDDIHIYQFINKDNGRSEVSELEFRTAPMIGYSFELFEDSSTSLFEEAKLALGIEQ